MRHRICFMSAVLSLVGWVGACLVWHAYGHPAGVRPDFFICLSLGITGVLAFVVSTVMPDQAALYALGYRDGMKCADCPLERTERVEPAPPRRHLSSV